MRSSDVDLVEMADSTIARRDSNIFKLHVHVVFGYNTEYDQLPCFLLQHDWRRKGMGACARAEAVR